MDQKSYYSDRWGCTYTVTCTAQLKDSCQSKNFNLAARFEGLPSHNTNPTIVIHPSPSEDAISDNVFFPLEQNFGQGPTSPSLYQQKSFSVKGPNSPVYSTITQQFSLPHGNSATNYVGRQIHPVSSSGSIYDGGHSARSSGSVSSMSSFGVTIVTDDGLPFPTGDRHLGAQCSPTVPKFPVHLSDFQSSPQRGCSPGVASMTRDIVGEATLTQSPSLEQVLWEMELYNIRNPENEIFPKISSSKH